MNEFVLNATFFSLVISLLGYELGVFLKKKTGLALCTPLLIAIVFVIAFLLVFRIDYESYEVGSNILSYFLTPSTVALAVPLYRQWEEQFSNWSGNFIRGSDEFSGNHCVSPCISFVPHRICDLIAEINYYCHRNEFK